MSPSTAYEDRLTEEAYWDSQYEPAASSVAPTPPARTKGLLGRLLGPRLRDLVQDYREHLVWNVLYPRYLPRRAGAKLLEVGSAPGTHLVQVHKSYGFDCYGVEYTPRGAELNRKVFRLNGLDPANVIHADFFSPEFQTRYRGYFDIVLSRGFIEHFRDVDRVLSAHLNVIAPGGMLAVTIPNLRGINYGLAWFFCKELLPLHNLDIMNGERFSKLFEAQGLIPLFCGYYGGFSFHVVDNRPAGFKGPVRDVCAKAQLVVNAAYRVFLKHGGAEHRWFSSHLAFIGVKQR